MAEKSSTCSPAVLASSSWALFCWRLLRTSAASIGLVALLSTWMKEIVTLGGGREGGREERREGGRKGGREGGGEEGREGGREKGGREGGRREGGREGEGKVKEMEGEVRRKKEGRKERRRTIEIVDQRIGALEDTCKPTLS